MDYLDYVFSINPYSPAMSKVEEDFAYYGSIEVDGSLWDQIGKLEQLIWLGKYMLAEMERRLDSVADPHPYIMGPIFQLTASLNLLLERGALLTSEYLAKNQNLDALTNLSIASATVHLGPGALVSTKGIVATKRYGNAKTRI